MKIASIHHNYGGNSVTTNPTTSLHVFNYRYTNDKTLNKDNNVKYMSPVFEKEQENRTKILLRGDFAQ